MLSQVRCLKCNGNMKLQSDPYGTYFSCLSCGSACSAKCPHCDTNSIIVQPSATGRSILCKVCLCSNRQLAMPECVKSTEPTLSMA